ncbi:MAG: helix-turn-helix domain-containing protein [Microcystaceae cyanobacterium]
MKKIPLIRLSQITPIIQTLDSLGSPSDKLLQKCHIPIYYKEMPNQLFPEYVVNLLLEKANQLEGEHFSILAAEYPKIETLGLIGNILSHSATLYEMLNNFLDYVYWHSTDAKFWLKMDSESVWFCRQGVNSIPIAKEASELYTVRLMIKIIQSTIDILWKPNQIYLQMSSQKNLFNCPAFINVPIFFKHPFTAIVFPRSLLWKTRSFVSSQVSIIEKPITKPNTDIKEALSQTIIAFLPEQACGINKISKMTGISVRTLQRELAKQNLSYSSLVQEIRLQQALKLLKNTRLKMTEIAQQLGYSEVSHFSRAFKTWTGISPLKYRKINQS